MSFKFVAIVLKLSRFSTCFILFLAILIPIGVHLQDWLYAFIYAVPILITCMNGFVINDISDIEADKVNHPERPLPQQDISEFKAVIVYYFLLAFTLIYIKLLIKNEFVFGYLLFLVGLINYNYVIRHTPSFKNIYISLVGTTPFIVLLSIIPHFENRIPVIIALFFFVLGREMLMDIQDEKGDGQTLVKRIGLSTSQNMAFSAQFIGIGLLFYASQSMFHHIIGVIMVMAEGYFVHRWHNGANKQKLISQMRGHFLCGIVYLM